MTLALAGKPRTRVFVLLSAAAALSFLAVVVGLLAFRGGSADATGLPDLTATKEAYSVDGAGPLDEVAVDEPFIWRITIANEGDAAAQFDWNDVLFRDNLPSGPAYQVISTSITLDENDHIVTCFLQTISRNPDNLFCRASTATVTEILSGVSFDIELQVTPSETGQLSNPRSNGDCLIDPANRVDESNTDNNSCQNTVTVVEELSSPEPSTLTIQKMTVDQSTGQWAPDTSSIDWDFRINGDPAAPGVAHELPAGGYTVSETVPEGWHVAGWVATTDEQCPDMAPNVVEPGEDSFQGELPQETALLVCAYNGQTQPLFATTSGGAAVVEHISWDIDKDLAPGEEPAKSASAGVTASFDFVIDATKQTTFETTSGAGQLALMNINAEGTDALVDSIDIDLDGASVFGCTIDSLPVTAPYLIAGNETLVCEWSIDTGLPLDGLDLPFAIAMNVDSAVPGPSETVLVPLFEGAPIGPLAVTVLDSFDGAAPVVVESGVDESSSFDFTGDFHCPADPSAYDSQGLLQLTANNVAQIAETATLSDPVAVTLNCTLPQAQLTLRKDVHGGGPLDSGDWLLKAQSGTEILVSGTDGVSGPVLPGASVELAEQATAPASDAELYELAAIICEEDVSGSTVLNWPEQQSPPAFTMPPADVTCTFTNRLRAGSVEVQKIVDWDDAPEGNWQFTICLQGPAPSTETDCRQVSDAGSDTLTWSGLVPGEYTLSEQDPGPAWSVAYSTQHVSVGPDEDVDGVTVTNTRQRGSLQVTKAVQWGDTTPDGTTFTICIDGPSYPLAGSARTETTDFAPGACRDLPDNGASSTTWDGLIEGDYTVTEIGTDSSLWAVDGSGTTVAVDAGEQASHTITNTRLSGDLVITMTIDKRGGDAGAWQFEVCITGPAPSSAEQCQAVDESGPGATWDSLDPGDYTIAVRHPLGDDDAWQTSVDSGDATNPDQAAIVDGETATASVLATLEHGRLGILKFYPDVCDDPPEATWPGIFIGGAELGGDGCRWPAASAGGFFGVPANVTVDISEVLPSGWTFTALEHVSGQCSLETEATAFGHDEPAPLDVTTGSVTVPPAEECVVALRNEPTGTVELIKRSTVASTGDEDWTFDVEAAGETVLTTPANPGGGTVEDSTTLHNIPAGTQAISLLDGGDACTAASLSMDHQTLAAAATGDEPDADDLEPAGGDAFEVEVEQGETTYVLFVSEPCGDVLAGANLFVRAFESADGGFNAGSPLGDVAIAVTGTAGGALGVDGTLLTDSSGMAGFGFLPAGVYTICKAPPPDYTVIGSSGNDGLGEIAGECREGVELMQDPARPEGVVVDFFSEPAASEPPTPDPEDTPAPPAGTATPAPAPTGTPTPTPTPSDEDDDPSDPEPGPTETPPAGTPAPSPTATETPPVQDTLTPTATSEPAETPAPEEEQTPTATAPVESPTPTPTPFEDVAGVMTPGPGAASPTPAPPETGSGSPASSGAVVMIVIAFLLLISSGLLAARRR